MRIKATLKRPGGSTSNLQITADATASVADIAEAIYVGDPQRTGQTTGPVAAPPRLTLQVTGTYRNLLGFMRDLETGPRILRTRSYRLERVDPNGGEMQLFLTVELLAQP